MEIFSLFLFVYLNFDFPVGGYCASIHTFGVEGHRHFPIFIQFD